jgi:hypothetical protein
MGNDIYIDMLHKQLYVSSEEQSGATPTGSSQQMTFGLSDFGELPGQSTWYIRSVKFYVMGYQDAGGVSPYTTCRFLGGVVNRDLSAAVRAELSDYQDIAGFPLKGVQKDIMIENTPQQNWFSYQSTYRPRKALTLNREQNFSWCAKNVGGNDMIFSLGIYLHAERGD